MKKPLVGRLLIPVVEIRISSGAMLVPTKGLDRLALIVLDAVNTVYLKQLVNTAYLESIATVFGADDIPVKVRCHRLTLCSYPLMREKCLIQPSPLNFEWTGINLFALRTFHPVRVSRSHAFIALARG
ncbi:hypothetical protein MXL28_05185 [Klebsiella aerogenes]|uniref:hypothetical protein n=1 Tax=Klebsiella aerogenes TaxID=548 RepID=UPI002DBBAC64|nr:hypothetical protein [Klebsiella aerogenes]MEB6652688.1 hypothetical protein [Klebsiella aerogenes]